MNYRQRIRILFLKQKPFYIQKDKWPKEKNQGIHRNAPLKNPRSQKTKIEKPADKH